MLMALAAGGYFAGVFHLSAHAGFKALLFLCSGVFIHTFHTNDIFELGRLGCGRLKVPAVTLVVGAAALSGIPPLSGYFSKEAVMGALAGLSNPAWLAAGLAGVFLTAYYSFRAIFILFRPKPGAPQPGPDPGHSAGVGESPGKADYALMAWPLIVLAAATVLFGFFEGPLEGFLSGGVVAEGAHETGGFSAVRLGALALAAAGLALSWFEFGRRGARQIGFVERIPPLFNLFSKRWYLDHFYRAFVSLVIDRGLARLCYLNDNKVIDGAIDGLGRGTVESGRASAFLQSGMIQYRLLTIFAVLAFLSLYFFF